MIHRLTELTHAALAAHDAVIDVRSPGEFAEDRVPGAINLPVLDDEERARIGTIYVQESRFLARRLGAALVARNIARHLDGALADRPATFRPLIYCWRGGMRSGAMASVLDQVGWRVSVLAGGYRQWRRAVVASLRASEEPLPVVLLDGQTGTAKTAILNLAATRGVQAIDLEALAAHRGSVFGASLETAQPSQKQFESALYDRLLRLDPARPILIEAESIRIGRIAIPRRLWLAMRMAPRIDIAAPPAARARYLVAAYGDIAASTASLEAAIARLAPFHDKAAIADWRGLASGGEHLSLAHALIEAHYDPLYDRARRKRPGPALAQIALSTFSPEALRAAGAEVAAVVARWNGTNSSSRA